MKQIVGLLSLAAVMVVSQTGAAEPTPTPEDCIRNLYRWYARTLRQSRPTVIVRLVKESGAWKVDKVQRGGD